MSKAEEIIDKYIEKFGGYPAFLMMGMSDEEIAAKMEESLRTGIPMRVDMNPKTVY